MNLKKLSDDDLIRLRIKIKNEANNHHMTQLALKIQLNSAFGALGNQYFRFYDVRLAEAITLSGQMISFYMEKILNDVLSNATKKTDKDFVIAMDTDSYYIELEDIVQKVYPNYTKEQTQEIVVFVDKVCKTKLQETFNNGYEKLSKLLNTPRNTLGVKREAIADKGIWTAKKRYLLNVYDKEGVRYDTPKTIIKGLEAIKSSTPESCKDAIKQVYRLLLNNTEEDVQNFIGEFRKEFDKSPPENIAKHTTVSYLKKYDVKSLSSMPKGVPYNSKAALSYNFLLDIHNLKTKYPPINEGDKIGIIYLKRPNEWGIEAIGFPDVLPIEFNLHNSIDYDIQFNKVFLDPVDRILELIKWKSSEEVSFFSLLG
jgi:DNA polymerase elongation subunit (family B)